MSNQDYDLLAKAAFDETDPQEDRLIEEWLAQDAEAQRLHSQMASLKRGLRALADVPECQLSAERLREAILSQGVKAKPVTPNWLKWAAPAGIAVCAAAFVFASGIINPPKNGAAAGSLATNDPVQTESTAPDLETMLATESSGSIRDQAAGLLDRAANLQEPAPFLDSAPAKPSALQSSPVRRSRPSASRRTVVADPAPANERLEGTGATDAVALKTAPVTDEGAALRHPGSTAMAFGAAAPAEFEEENQVVVLGNVEPETRAAGAVEIQKHDVVFGG